MLEDQPVIKSGASAASPMTRRGQGSPRTGAPAREPLPALSACRAVVCALPCILVIGVAALAADLIMGLILKHLEQNLTAKTHPKAHFS